MVEKKGLYAAGFMAYEAASAFNPILKVNKSSDLPLIWFGLYAQMEPFEFAPRASSCTIKIPCHPSVSDQQYYAAIDQIQRHIYDSDTYQVNYCYRLNAPYQKMIPSIV